MEPTITPHKHAGPRLHAYRIELFRLEEQTQRLDFPLSSDLVEAPPEKLLEPGASTTHDLNTGGPRDCACTAPPPQALDRSANPKKAAFIIVDQRATMLFGSGQVAKSVVAAQAAAVFVWRAAALRAQLGAVIFNDHTIEDIRPRQAPLRARLILHVLLTLNQALSPYSLAQSDLRMLNEALRRTANSPLTDSSIFLITDGSGWNKQTTGLITRLAKRNKVTVVLVYDPRQVDSKSLKAISGRPFEAQQGIGRDDGQRSKSPRRSLELSSHLLCGPFPREVSIVPIHTQADVVLQFSRLWGKTSVRRQLNIKEPPQTPAPRLMPIPTLPVEEVKRWHLEAVTT